MAIRDVFNNSTDNYMKTGLAPCTGTDENIFEFLPKKEVGIVNGSQILQTMYIGDVQIEVSAWEQNKKILAPGEVIYIAGLTKDLDNRSQTFVSDRFIPDTSLLYMEVEFTINYNSNFKNVSSIFHCISDPSSGVNVVNAINTSLAASNIGVTAAIDSSTVKFTGSTAGYNFTVTDPIVIKDYDASMNVLTSWTVPEDITKSVEYAKYINGAMLGVIVKPVYPDDQSTYDKWLYLSHVNNTFSYWDSSVNEYYTKFVDTGSSTVSTSTVMCAGDYLNYITVNEEWDKIGYLYMKLNTFNQDGTDQKNLVPGFYLFNPHAFNVEVNYMMIN